MSIADRSIVAQYSQAENVGLYYAYVVPILTQRDMHTHRFSIGSCNFSMPLFGTTCLISRLRITTSDWIKGVQDLHSIHSRATD